MAESSDPFVPIGSIRAVVPTARLIRRVMLARRRAHEALSGDPSRRIAARASSLSI
jgi:hypothetical protein